MIQVKLSEHIEHSFSNPFRIADLLIFDRSYLPRVLAMTHSSPEQLGWSLQDAPAELVERILEYLPEDAQSTFQQALTCPLAPDEKALARHLLLDALFWELTYWKTPEMYEELVAGEYLHPGIFQQLQPYLQNNTVLDAGAGCGRASFAALEHGARLVYAVEPSPGLRRLCAKKRLASRFSDALVLQEGDFAHIPLPTGSVDVALTCSAFTSNPEQGGEPGLAEFKRVTRPGGSIVLIWPRRQDRSWLAKHGFHYVMLPQDQEMFLTFSSWQSAWRCVKRFYARNELITHYLRLARQPALPFSLLKMDEPRDYCWLQVT